MVNLIKMDNLSGSCTNWGVDDSLTPDDVFEFRIIENNMLNIPFKANDLLPAISELDKAIKGLEKIYSQVSIKAIYDSSIILETVSKNLKDVVVASIIEEKLADLN